MTSEFSIPALRNWSDQFDVIPNRPKPHPNLGWGKVKIKKPKLERAADHDTWKAQGVTYQWRTNMLIAEATAKEREKAEADMARAIERGEAEAKMARASFQAHVKAELLKEEIIKEAELAAEAKAQAHALTKAKVAEIITDIIKEAELKKAEILKDEELIKAQPIKEEPLKEAVKPSPPSDFSPYKFLFLWEFPPKPSLNPVVPKKDTPDTSQVPKKDTTDTSIVPKKDTPDITTVPKKDTPSIFSPLREFSPQPRTLIPIPGSPPGFTELTVDPIPIKHVPPNVPPLPTWEH
jgi:hypothetical protein